MKDVCESECCLMLRVTHRLLAVTPVLILCLFLAGCAPSSADEANLIRVRVRADGQERVLSADSPMTVRQFLQNQNIQTGDLDRLNPSDFTPIVDNMVITIVRVENRPECIEEEVAYATETLKTPDLGPGVTRVMRPGEAGKARVCFDVVYEDGVEKSRAQSSRTLLSAAVNQIMAVGVDSSRLEPISVLGSLGYLSGGQARLITNISNNQVTLQTGGSLDGQVFAFSSDGRQLLFTRRPETPKDGTYNELWLVLDTANPNAEPLKLVIENVLTADWIPEQPFSFSYSTLQVRNDPPGYQAFNDLYIARLDSNTGKILKAERVVTPGLQDQYGLWGIRFAWSPDGGQLAWAKADGVGIVDLQQGALLPLLSFRPYTTTLSNGWLWLPDLAWNSKGDMFGAMVHGDPVAEESPETSPAFDLAVFNPVEGFGVPSLRAKVGMWGGVQFQPGEAGGIAYLQARIPIDSVSSEYDLVLADRDGSNPKILFPGSGKPGIRPLTDGDSLAWSPDGKAIAVVYEGDLYIIDMASGRSTQVTLVGNVTHPRWVR
jgi:resuscitation-promoting factor RpfB